MLSERDINALVRDEKAWRRALRLHGEPAYEEEAALVHAAAAPRSLSRRGSADNAATLRFLASLRTLDGLRAPREEWSASTRIDGNGAPGQTDVLTALLQRNAAAKGFTHHYQPRPATSRHREERRQTAAERVQPMRGHGDPQEAADLLAARRAATERAAVTMAARQKALREAAAVQERWQKRIDALLQEEYECRRFVFRTAMAEKGAVFDAEAEAFIRLTGYSHETHAKVMHLEQREEARRSAIARDNARARGIVEQLARLDEVRIVEREIAMCAQRERRLLSKVSSHATR